MLFDPSIEIMKKIQDTLLVNYDTAVVYHLWWDPQKPGEWKARVKATRYGIPYYFVFMSNGDHVLSWDDQDAPLPNNRYHFGCEIAPETRSNMQIETFVRRPFDVNAVQVTPQNAHEIAEWCNGKVGTSDYKLAGTKVSLDTVLVPGNGPNKGQMVEARIGSWVVEHLGNFRVYRKKQFEDTFFTQPKAGNELLRVEDLVEVIDPKDPMFGRQGQVELINQICVTVPGAGGYMFNPFDLKWIAEYSEETKQQVAREAMEALENPVLDKLNAIRAAAEAGIEVDIPVQGSVAEESSEPVTEIHGIRTGCTVRVKLDANMFFGQTGTVLGLGKDGVRVLVVLHENATRDLLEPVPFQWDELEVISMEDAVPHLERTESTDRLMKQLTELEGKSVDDFERDQMVKLRESRLVDGLYTPAGTTARVTVVGIDMPGTDEFGIEIMFSDGRYGNVFAREIEKI